ncbi:MAG: hypothetical protein WBV55_01925 [Candidatus Sulfotelmatobacter sp.]
MAQFHQPGGSQPAGDHLVLLIPISVGSVVNEFDGHVRPREWGRLPLDRASHLSGMNLEMQFEMPRAAPFFLRQPAEPMPPPIKEPPSPMENPDAPVREPDPDEPEQI